MVDKAIDLAETLAKFGPKPCSIYNAFVIILCFFAIGLITGFAIGTNLTP